MDGLTPAQEDLDIAVAIAGELDVDDGDIATHGEFLTDVDEEGRDRYTAGNLQSFVIEIAQCHDDVCDEEDCCLCQHLRDALAVVVASLRADLNDELQRAINFDPAAARRRAQRIPRPPHNPQD